MKHFRRLRAILAFLFNRPLRISVGAGQLRGGAEAHLFPADLCVLPVMAGGAPDPEPDPEPKDPKEPEPDPEPDPEPKDPKEPEPDWKRESRKHERRAKKEKDEADALRTKLKQREEADKSEQEKAIDKAREEGKQEALTVAEKERRKDRLESAVTRAAGKKIKVGEGDDAKELRFEDPEDAEVFLQRKIARGDLDEGDLFDADGKPKASVIGETLKEILEEKPRLAEDSGGAASRTAAGSADGGKGRGSGDDEPADMNDLLRRRN